MTAAAPQLALRLDGIGRSFGAIQAVKDVDLSVRRGEFFTFLGPSGSGKSTVLRMVAGLERVDQGRILVDDRDVTAVPPWKRDISMVFQQYALFPHLDVAQNVAYGMRMRGTPRAEIARTTDHLLALVGLDGFQKRRVARLSGGEQQRVALARGLAARPALLLLDEPLGALDEKVRREMQRELKRIHSETGTTFVYVTHDQEEALTMSDRIAVFNRGTVVQCDEPEAVFEKPRLRFVASFFRGFNVLDARVLGAADGQLRVELAGRALALSDAPARAPKEVVGLGIRGEKLRIGPSARDCGLVLDGMLEDIVYKGVNVDHIVRLADGQSVVVTSVRREVDPGSRAVAVGCEPAEVVVLED